MPDMKYAQTVGFISRNTGPRGAPLIRQGLHFHKLQYKNIIAQALKSIDGKFFSRTKIPPDSAAICSL